jgi:hypothetical protein
MATARRFSKACALSALAATLAAPAATRARLKASRDSKVVQKELGTTAANQPWFSASPGSEHSLKKLSSPRNSPRGKIADAINMDKQLSVRWCLAHCFPDATASPLKKDLSKWRFDAVKGTGSSGTLATHRTMTNQ